MKNKRKHYLILRKIRKNAIFIGMVVFFSTILVYICQLVIDVSYPFPATAPYPKFQLISSLHVLFFAVMISISVYFFIIGTIYENKQTKISVNRMNRSLEFVRKKFMEMHLESIKFQCYFKLVNLLEQVEESVSCEENDRKKEN